jgi:hypothetical protein
MSGPQQIVPGGCTRPTFPLDPGPRHPAEAMRALKDRIARRIGRTLRRLLRPSSTSG